MRSRLLWKVGSLITVTAIIILGIYVISTWLLPQPIIEGRTIVNSTISTASGRKLYAQRCASCHGINLEGQPNWKRRLASGRLPAPPHNASGHTWHHPDEILFRITKEGSAAVAGGGYESDMPRFGDRMTDMEIKATIDFIKSTWPDRERNYQQQMNGPAPAPNQRLPG